MKFDKTTKNTVVFAEVEEPGQEPLIPKLYIRKEAFDGERTPMAITVKVEEA
ncbi:MAG: hypothetical protein KAJ19_25515 [Gammaproteobacteria bacterium]|nr:hypothetical protein [Gammaproteobacteria bacterium]